MGNFLKQQAVALIALIVAGAAIFMVRRDVDDLRQRVDALANRPVRAPAPTPSPVPEWSCTGKLAAEHVRQVIGANGQAVYACYQAVLPRAPTLTGSLMIHLRIGAQGTVTGTKFAGTMSDPQVIECVSALATKWRFPPPAGGECTIVSAPFSFEPPEG